MKKYIAIGIVLAISILINLFFLFGKGIIVNVSNTNHQEQYQYQQQWQGQLLINQFMTQGNTIEWKSVECTWDNYQATLNSLHPVSALYAKVIYMVHAIPTYIIIVYPDIFTKTKEVEIKK